jgi:hypothetical protein
VLPPQLGDVTVTFADIRAAEADLQYHPRTSLRDGIERFIDWYREHYQITSAAVQEAAEQRSAYCQPARPASPASLGNVAGST